jgi:hypothetical protein
MTAPEEPDGYFRAIEEAFNRRRGAPLLLSPRDWALIGEWQSGGIPLRVVLQGIENCFDARARRAPTARRINSLSYCRQEVLGLHEIYLGLRGVEAGRPATTAPNAAAADAFPVERTLARHLGRLTRRVRESMAFASEAGLDRLVGALASTAAELKRLRKGIASARPAPGALEQALEQLDAGLIDAARQALPEGDWDSLVREAAAALGDSGSRMTPEALTATRHVAAVRLLRARCRLPRLTLFD